MAPFGICAAIRTACADVKNENAERVMSDKLCHVAVIIVGFRNSNDVCGCINALALATPAPRFDIFICENGGNDAYRELIDALLAAQGPCIVHPNNLSMTASSSFEDLAEAKCLSLKGRPTSVWIARSTHNLGYAGGVNAWIRRLQTDADWDGFWVLNPDTQPYPDALAHLVQRAIAGNKGMISSTLVPAGSKDYVHNRGLRWDKIMARTTGLGHRNLVSAPYDLSAIEAAMDSPSGASMYITRTCVENIGLMDDRFFLYYEDIDWGLRAKQCGLGYAGECIIPHEGGTTIGKSSAHRASRSKLTVYLESRNRILFVRKHFPWMLPYASVMSVLYALQYLWAGAPENFRIALRGILAGWNGEAGPPPESNDSTLQGTRSNIPKAVYRKVKLALSLIYHCGQVIWCAALRIVGCPPAPRLVILYYHGIPDNCRFEFARQMKMLATLANVVRADHQGELLSNKLNVAITFDDALDGLSRNALPELASRSFHSTIFVPVDLVGRAPDWDVDEGAEPFAQAVMTAAQLMALPSALVEIGSHSFHHVHLAKTDRRQAKFEIENSLRVLKQLVGRKITLFAFPYGDYDEYVVELCKSSGCKYVYTAEPDRVEVNSDFVRGRVKVEPTDGQLEFFLKISGAYCWTAKAKEIAKWPLLGWLNVMRSA